MGLSRLRGVRGVAWALVAGAAVLGGAERRAEACGGCVQPPISTVVSTITAERMIFSISPTQSTLYDEINYSGSPESFGWILPIRGTVTVGLSADLLFATLDALTATTVVEPTPTCGYLGGGGAAGGTSGGGGGSGGT
jgi:Uncharacterized protein conserved in bacteria (DUF2330)